MLIGRGHPGQPHRGRSGPQGRYGRGQRIQDRDAPDDRQRLEERLAHLERSLAEVSDVVARQDRSIATLERRVALLMQREAERELDAGGGVVLGDETPPHW